MPEPRGKSKKSKNRAIYCVDFDLFRILPIENYNLIQLGAPALPVQNLTDSESHIDFTRFFIVLMFLSHAGKILSSLRSSG